MTCTSLIVHAEEVLSVNSMHRFYLYSLKLLVFLGLLILDLVFYTLLEFGNFARLLVPVRRFHEDSLQENDGPLHDQLGEPYSR